MNLPDRASDAGPNQKEDARDYITRGPSVPNPLIEKLRAVTPEPTRYACIGNGLFFPVGKGKNRKGGRRG